MPFKAHPSIPSLRVFQNPRQWRVPLFEQGVPTKSLAKNQSLAPPGLVNQRMGRKSGQQTGRYLPPLTDHMCRVPTHMPAQVELGASGNPTGWARRCLPETQAKGDLTAESASQTRRVGGRGPPSQEGWHPVRF